MPAEHTDNSQECFLNELPQYTEIQAPNSYYQVIRELKSKTSEVLCNIQSKYCCANVTEI